MQKLFTFTIFISGIIQTHALVISEIMYDPEGSDTTCACEWVEVFNDTSNGVDFSSWKFFENGTNHGLVSNGGSSIIAPNSYAIIADNPTKFLIAYPSFSGILFDSVFTGSLSNIGEHISLKESSSGSEISPVDYDVSLGGNNDGSTLSKINGVWVRGKATPGAENQALPLEISSSGSSTTKTENQTTISQTSLPSPDIVLYMPFEKTVVAGAESDFMAYGLTRAGKSIDGLTFNWAFGDGGQAVGTSTKYRYAYPGRYITQVQADNGHVSGMGRMVVRVVTPDILITKIETGKYGAFVDIKNPNNYDLDLSQWRLMINNSYFPFPKNTLIAGNSTTHFSGASMGFANTIVSSSTVVKILFPNLEEVTKFENNIPDIKSSVVLGTSTISNIIKINPKIINKPAVKIVSKPTTVASSTNIVIQSHNTKDTRLIAWFKSLFGM